jgi:hypothetical protein
MRKDINIKERIVHMYDVDTGIFEDEIINYLDKQMKVRFHSAFFNNSKYIFISRPSEQVPNSITVSEYRKKGETEKSSAVIIE